MVRRKREKKGSPSHFCVIYPKLTILELSFFDLKTVSNKKEHIKSIGRTDRITNGTKAFFYAER